MVDKTYQYAIIKDGEVVEIRNTLTTIPEEQWEKKNVLPYELIMVDVPDTEELNTNTLEILSDKVLETRYKAYHVPTLEEYKSKKLEELKQFTKAYVDSIFPDYKQLSALSTLADPDNDAPYTIEEANYIRSFVTKHTLEVRRLKPLIEACTTKEEIDSHPDSVEYPLEV